MSGRGDRFGNVLLVLLAPLVLAWTGWNFWRLATVGTIPVRLDERVVDANAGLVFWVTLGLYVLLFVGALVTLAKFAGWLRRRGG
jgi:hypothetical protein